MNPFEHNIIIMSVLARTSRVARVISNNTQSKRSFAAPPGGWPGPNPIKDVIVGCSIGLVFALGWKQWQMHDKAERIRFYKEYDRLVKAEEDAKRNAA